MMIIYKLSLIFGKNFESEALQLKRNKNCLKYLESKYIIEYYLQLVFLLPDSKPRSNPFSISIFTFQRWNWPYMKETQLEGISFVILHTGNGSKLL